MNNKKLYKNLTKFLEKFKNRPNHLSKFLIDNDALSANFIEKIQKIDKITEKNDISLDNVNFKNISQMEDFYNSILDEDVTIKKTVKELTKEYNDKLNYLIDNEMYEEAAKMRDYMSGNNIKRISKKR
jgi:hypothetical protein